MKKLTEQNIDDVVLQETTLNLCNGKNLSKWQKINRREKWKWKTLNQLPKQRKESEDWFSRDGCNRIKKHIEYDDSWIINLWTGSKVCTWKR